MPMNHAPNINQIPWDTIVSVTGLKLDTLTVDTVVLTLLSADGTTFEFSEDHPSYKHLLQLLPENLPNFPRDQDWLWEIVQTPFATNTTHLWSSE